MEKMTNSPLTELFDNQTVTSNGDVAYKKLQNPLLDILFKSEYLRHNLDEAVIGTSDKERIFAEFIRDPRYGLGQKDLGIHLLNQCGASFAEIVMCGRGDDLWKMYANDADIFSNVCHWVYEEINSKSDISELLKKWCPRFSAHNKVVIDGKKVKQPFTKKQLENTLLARRIATVWGMNKQQYTKFVKTTGTVEFKLSHHQDDSINFSQVPSLAAIKYASTFSSKETIAERYKKYLEDVRSGNAEIKMSTTTVYDIYKNAYKPGFDADLWWSKLEKISGSFLPIVDVSGSMQNQYDSMGKALSIGYYLSECSTFCNRQFVTFSERPKLVDIGDNGFVQNLRDMSRADWGMNTNLGAVMELLKDLTEKPEYLVVLTDMGFDHGSRASERSLIENWRKQGINTKIIWWNLNAGQVNSCAPEISPCGNIFMSGYSPMLLKYLESGFDGNQFLDKLLEEYAKNIVNSYCYGK